MIAKLKYAPGYAIGTCATTVAMFFGLLGKSDETVIAYGYATLGIIAVLCLLAMFLGNAKQIRELQQQVT